MTEWTEKTQTLVDVLLAKDEIRDLMSRYLVLTDENRVTERSELFTTDCFLNVTGIPLHGREATRQARADQPEGQRRRVKHVVTDCLIDVEGDRATALSSFLMLVPSDDDTEINCHVAGRYSDELLRENGRWYIKSRIAHPDLRRQGH